MKLLISIIEYSISCDKPAYFHFLQKYFFSVISFCKNVPAAFRQNHCSEQAMAAIRFSIFFTGGRLITIRVRIISVRI